MDISVTELSRFTNLNRIDEILDFLGDRMRARLLNSDLKQSNADRLRGKERETLAEYEAQVERLKIKQAEKEGLEKGYKAKLKEAHG